MVDAGAGYAWPVLEDPNQNWSLRAAADSDAQWIAELRARVLRPDLERLGRFDPDRVRQRFLSAFDPGVTQVVLVGGQEAGSIAVRPDEGSLWIEHFYLRADCQGRGIGSLVLQWELDASRGGHPFRGVKEGHLEALQTAAQDGAPVRRGLEKAGATAWAAGARIHRSSSRRQRFQFTTTVPASRS